MSRNQSYGTIACNAPSLPGSVVQVTESDMGHYGGMMMGGDGIMGVSLQADPSSIPAGTVSFVVTNEGNLAHEMIVMPMGPDGPGTRPVRAESTGWLTLHLKPGTYELICEGPWHYAVGMFDTLVVT